MVNKPWGYYQDIFRSSEVVFKLIGVRPGECLSYQSHDLREEFWFIKSGKGRFTLEGDDQIVHTGDSLYIGKKQKHKIENIGNEYLMIYEMQCGECRETDIFRFEDKYGRT